MMVQVDLGSPGSWLLLEDYQLDFISMSFIKNLYSFTWDAMTSFKTRQYVATSPPHMNLSLRALTFSPNTFLWTNFTG